MKRKPKFKSKKEGRLLGNVIITDYLSETNKLKRQFIKEETGFTQA